MDSNKLFLGIEIPYNIGELNKRKIDALQENFSENFPNAFSGRNGELVLEREDRTTNIVLTDSILRMDISNYNNRENKNIKSYLEKLINIFMLDDDFSNIIFRIVSKVNVDFDTMGKTRELGKNVIDEGFENVSGIGFRYIIEKDNSTYDEFKFEPFLADRSQFYFEGIFNDVNVNINQLDNLIDDKIIEFNDMMKSSIKKVEN